MRRQCERAVKALIVANHFLETELEKLRVVSTGYARGKLLRVIPERPVAPAVAAPVSFAVAFSDL